VTIQLGEEAAQHLIGKLTEALAGLKAEAA
jgi:hypothetical protein